jgi:hypothetical protein
MTRLTFIERNDMRRSCRWRFAVASLALAAAAAAQVGAAPADWRLGPDGYGPLKVGMSFAQARKIAPRLTSTPANLLATAGCDQLPLPGRPGVALMFVDGVLARIDLFRPGVRTTRGVQPGDRIAQAMRAYPGLSAEPNKYDDAERYLTGHTGDSAIRFETNKGRIDKVYAGRWAQVQYVEGCL